MNYPRYSPGATLDRSPREWALRECLRWTQQALSVLNEMIDPFVPPSTTYANADGIDLDVDGRIVW